MRKQKKKGKCEKQANEWKRLDGNRTKAHLGGRPTDGKLTALGAVVCVLLLLAGETEIGNLGALLGADKHVACCNVAVHETWSGEEKK